MTRITERSVMSLAIRHDTVVIRHLSENFHGAHPVSALVRLRSSNDKLSRSRARSATNAPAAEQPDWVWGVGGASRRDCNGTTRRRFTASSHRLGSQQLLSDS